MILPIRSLTLPDPDYLALWNESRATGKTIPAIVAKAVHRYATAIPSRPLLEWVTVVDSVGGA